MSSSSLFSRRSYGALMSRLVWPTATLLLLTLGFVFTTVLWTSDSANVVAGKRQRMQLTGAIEQKLGELKSRLAQFAATTGSSESGPADRGAVQSLPPPSFDFVGLFVVGDGGRLVRAHARDAGDVGPAPTVLADLIEAARASGLESARDLSGSAVPSRDLAVSRLLYDGAAALAAVALPITGRAESGEPSAERMLVAAGYKRLDPAELRNIADLHAIDGLRLLVAPPAEGWVGLPILDGRGEARAYLAWSAERPGDVMRERLVPLTLFGSLVAIALFAFVVGYIRWIARDLRRARSTPKISSAATPYPGCRTGSYSGSGSTRNSTG